MTDDSISPLRRRMIEDMTVRGFTACTRRSYIAAVRRFTVFVGRSPDQAMTEDLRRFQLQMRVEGASSTTMNAAVSALRFFFRVTLGRGDAELGMTTVREPRKLPVVLSPEEVTRLLNAAPGLKYRAALSLSYGAGLRASPAAALTAIVLFSWVVRRALARHDVLHRARRDRRLRHSSRGVEPNIALVEMDSMDGQINDALWRERMFARLTGAFGMLALLLACIGLYGTIAYGVARRRAEIAVRIALGAARSQILWLVLSRALVLAAAGLAIGVPLVFWSGRFLASQLVGVTPRDPVALVGAAVALTLGLDVRVGRHRFDGPVLRRQEHRLFGEARRERQLPPLPAEPRRRRVQRAHRGPAGRHLPDLHAGRPDLLHDQRGPRGRSAPQPRRVRARRAVQRATDGAG